MCGIESTVQLSKDRKPNCVEFLRRSLALRYNRVSLVPGLHFWPKKDKRLNHILPRPFGPALKLNTCEQND